MKKTSERGNRSGLDVAPSRPPAVKRVEEVNAASSYAMRCGRSGLEPGAELPMSDSTRTIRAHHGVMVQTREGP
jgi:hypothetical protein